MEYVSRLSLCAETLCCFPERGMDQRARPRLHDNVPQRVYRKGIDKQTAMQHSTAPEVCMLKYSTLNKYHAGVDSPF